MFFIDFPELVGQKTPERHCRQDIRSLLIAEQLLLLDSSLSLVLPNLGFDKSKF